MEECTQFIKGKRESRHLKTLERQKSNLIDCAKRVGREKVATPTCKMVTMIIHV